MDSESSQLASVVSLSIHVVELSLACVVGTSAPLSVSFVLIYGFVQK